MSDNKTSPMITTNKKPAENTMGEIRLPTLNPSKVNSMQVSSHSNNANTIAQASMKQLQ